MHLATSVLLSLLIVPAAAYARLGETAESTELRYGKTVRTHESKGDTLYFHSLAACLRVVIVYQDGRVASEHVSTTEFKPFTQAEVEIIETKVIPQGLFWKKEARPDGKGCFLAGSDGTSCRDFLKAGDTEFVVAIRSKFLSMKAKDEPAQQSTEPSPAAPPVPNPYAIHARLAETKAEIEARYGEPLKTVENVINGRREVMAHYRATGLDIVVGYSRGRCAIISSRNPEAGFSETQIRQFLEATGLAGTTWTPMPSREDAWTSSDRNALAVYKRSERTLWVMVTAFANRLANVIEGKDTSPPASKQTP